MSYDVGTRVVVCSNDYVLQRVPHLVGQVGTIEVAPIHPSTWCTIAMDDGVTTVKLQPTAIRHLDDGTTEDDSPSSSVATPPRPATPPAKYNRPRAYSSPAGQIPSQTHRLVHGAKVTIIGTENVEQRVPQYIGMEGTIKEVPIHPATWYKVQFPDGRVVTFRPSALRLTSDLSSYPEEPLDFDEEAPPSKKKKPTRGRSRTLSVGSGGSSRRLAAVDSENWTDCQVRIQSGKLAGQVASVKASGNGWVQLETPYGEVAKRASDLEILSREGTSEDALPSSPSLRRVRSFSESHISTPSHHANVIVPAKLVSMKRDYVRKFIEKQQAMNRNRPELTYWLHSIRSASIDSNAEAALARDTLNVCDTCNVELWPGATYCWNECCPASPVYYRLPGAAGSIPLHRCHVLKSRAISPDITELQEMSEACEILSSWRTPQCSVVNDFVCSAPTSVLEAAPPLTASSQRKDSCATDCEVASNGSFSNSLSDDTTRIRIARPPLNTNAPASPRFKKFGEYPCSPPPSHEEFARIVSQHPVVPSSSLSKYNAGYSNNAISSVTSQLSKNKLTPVTNVANTSPLVMNETIPSIKELYNNTTQK